MKTKFVTLAFVIVLLSVAASAPPEPPHRVYGQISDENGDPISDADVEFRYEGSTLVEGSTDSDGYYDVKIPYDSNYEGEDVSLFVNGENTTESVVFESGGTTELNGSIDNTPGSHSVSGTITSDGEEVGNAFVEFIYDNDVVADDSTDSSGDYSVDIPYSSNYEGEAIQMYVEGTDTEKTIEFTTDGSTTLDFEADWLIDDSETDGGSTGSTDGGSGSSGTTDDSDDSDSDNETEQDNSKQEQENNDDTSPELSFTGLTVPEETETGETITIEVTLENSGDEAGEETFTVEAGGETVEDITVTVEPGETETVEVSTSFEGQGVYTVTAGDLSSDITVEEQEQSNSSLPILPISVIVLVIVTSVYLGRERILDLAQGILESETSEEERGSFEWKYAKNNEE